MNIHANRVSMAFLHVADRVSPTISRAVLPVLAVGITYPQEVTLVAHIRVIRN